MKKIPWAGIVGGIIVILFLISGVSDLTEPSHIQQLNVANGISDLVWVCFGAFLIFISLKKHNQPLPASSTELDPTRSLWMKRNKFFFYVTAVSFLASVSTWLLIDLSQGLTLITVGTIFDFVMNLVLVYLAFQLFFQKDVVNKFLYAVIVYTIGSLIMYFLRHEWLTAVIYILFAFYFIYSIKAPLNLKNFRISQYIILPAVFVLMFALQIVDSKDLTQMLKDEATLEQQMLNNADDINSIYAPIAASEIPTQKELAYIEETLNTREKIIADLTDVLHKMRSEYSNQMRSEDNINNIAYIDHTLALLKIHTGQVQKMHELMDYYQGINPAQITDAQNEAINVLMFEIEEFNKQLRDATLEFDKQQQ